MTKTKLALGCILILVSPPVVRAAAPQSGSIRGTVVDPLGAAVPGTVVLYRAGVETARTGNDSGGAYAFHGLAPGRYRVEAAAEGFAPGVSEPLFLGVDESLTVDVTVPIGRLEQHVSVTAAAAALPLAQLGAPVAVLDAGVIERLGKPDILETLRVVPGLSVVQTGARGGTASVFTRGGEADYTRVFIDGAPANDIGGAFSFHALTMAAVDSVEVLRTANSVLHGVDAMTGVIRVETRRGRTPLPELAYALDGGNLGTSRHELSLGQAVHRFDYFVDASRFDTDNDVPNNAYRNDTLAGRAGFFLGRTTDISATARRIETDLGSPNGILFFGVPDDSHTRDRVTYATVRSVSEVERVRVSLRYAYTVQDAVFTNPSPTGEAFDPFGFGANYLGDELTVTGRNGFSATGRAILDYGGVYPSVFRTNSSRRRFAGTVDVALADGVDLSFGGRAESESGWTTFASPAHRRNQGAFVEGRGRLGGRLFLAGGVGFEDHAVFGYEAVPRFSLAFYARGAASTGAVGETKLMFNAGRGIKAPTVTDDRSSLFALLSGLADGADLVDRIDARPIGPESARTLDAGVEQSFWGGRVRVGASYFDNVYTDLIEFVAPGALPRLGVPGDAADATGFGAAVNSGSFDARGVELSGDLSLTNRFRVSGWYTFLDAEVTRSLTGGALEPSVNPAFPNIEIGQYAPLVGARPFRRPAHSGHLLVTYGRGPVQVSLAGSFVGRQDDSTFLSDAFFGPAMLLPNADLSGGYRKIDLSGSYQAHPRVRLYSTIENLFDEEITATAGFPGLPFTIRSGVRFILGGESI